MTTPASPLLGKKSATPSCSLTKFAACLLAAAPTAMLNGLAAIAGDSTTADALHSPDDLQKLLNDSDLYRLLYGAAALIASEVVLFYMNQQYLFPSVNATIDLLKKDADLLRSLFCCATLATDQRPSVLENICFFWSIVTSLIFAEMGSLSLSFLGKPGEIVGFSLSLFVYFSTRFFSVKGAINNKSNAHSQLKKNYIKKINRLKDDDTLNELTNYLFITTGLETQPNYTDYLKIVDENWMRLKKSKVKILCIERIGPAFGLLLAAVTLLPIFTGFIPLSVQGAEQLTQSDIGASSQYQNGASFSFGIFATLLTSIFYFRSIKTLPTQLIQMGSFTLEHASNSEYLKSLKLLVLTTLSFSASYPTGVGFKFVAETARQHGYFSYLKPVVSGYIPDGILVAVVAMLWSHLQGHVNLSTSPTNQPNSSYRRRMVIDWLQRPETDISSLITSSTHEMSSGTR